MLENINEIASQKSFNALDEVKKLLANCQSILNVWEICVERVKNLQNLSVDSVRTLFDYLPETIKCIFHHCRHRYICQRMQIDGFTWFLLFFCSKTLYDTYLFDSTTAELCNLFRKACGIFKYFPDICENASEFDGEIHSEMPLIVKGGNVDGWIFFTFQQY